MIVVASGTDKQKDFERDVADRFGLVPNFFRTASEAPGLIAELWSFAKSAYLDNPMPSLFKERLFVHLSRFCEVRYCIVRHVGFLCGKGHPSGDPRARPQTLKEIVELLRGPGLPSTPELDASLSRLAASKHQAFPAPGTSTERDIFNAASVLFLEPMRAARPLAALMSALGVKNFELLTAFLAFIRTAHYWTMMHPDLVLEEDVDALLERHEELAALLLNDPEAGRCAIGVRLFEELVGLRQERDDREALRRALTEREEAQRHQTLLIAELNHRVKNTLAVVQSIANQTLRGAEVAEAVSDAFMARLRALAHAHDLLTEAKWDGADLGAILARALSGYGAGSAGPRIRLSGPPLRLSPREAVSLALVGEELATNATKFGALSNETGQVEISWDLAVKQGVQWLCLRWCEDGGPCVVAPLRKGYGTHLLQEVLQYDVDGEVTLDFAATGLLCTVRVPISMPDRTHRTL